MQVHHRPVPVAKGTYLHSSCMSILRVSAVRLSQCPVMNTLSAAGKERLTTLRQNRLDTFYWQYQCHTREPQPFIRLLVLTCMTSISDQLYLKYS